MQLLHDLLPLLRRLGPLAAQMQLVLELVVLQTAVLQLLPQLVRALRLASVHGRQRQVPLRAEQLLLRVLKRLLELVRALLQLLLLNLACTGLVLEEALLLLQLVLELLAQVLGLLLRLPRQRILQLLVPLLVLSRLDVQRLVLLPQTVHLGPVF